jgi:prepilin peptidase CpaA
MPVTVVLLALLAVASVTDVLWHRIYNWTTYPGILAGLGLSGLGSILAATGGRSIEELVGWGWIPITDSALGLLGCGGLMLVCFVLFPGIGAADLKLLAMMGTFLGLENGFKAMLWTFTLGACMGMIVLIWRVGPAQLVRLAMRQLFWTLRLGQWGPLTDEERKKFKSRLFLAPCALAAAVIVQFELAEMLM